MNILFVADPLVTFKTYKDTTFAMMRELQKRGHTLAACEPQHLQWQTGQPVTALVRRIELTGEADDWYRVLHQGREALHTFDAVLMRKDPPFDSEFFYATHLLEQAEREGARVFNSPRALRDHPEKLALMEFAEFAPPTLVTRSPEAIRHFHADHKDIILKPLDGMGGMGIFRVGPDGMNLGSITETLNQGGATSVMVQAYLPAIVDGDKRLLLIGGKVAPFVLARI
ncbi:MAG: glutathione synthase, partial [Hydrogenophaga sp.]|nr:glutathione synthase [Hydrogenophaga sp.]